MMLGIFQEQDLGSLVWFISSVRGDYLLLEFRLHRSVLEINQTREVPGAIHTLCTVAF